MVDGLNGEGDEGVITRLMCLRNEKGRVRGGITVFIALLVGLAAGMVLLMPTAATTLTGLVVTQPGILPSSGIPSPGYLVFYLRPPNLPGVSYNPITVVLTPGGYISSARNGGGYMSSAVVPGNDILPIPGTYYEMDVFDSHFQPLGFQYVKVTGSLMDLTQLTVIKPPPILPVYQWPTLKLRGGG